jgi:hypothetical protein
VRRDGGIAAAGEVRAGADGICSFKARAAGTRLMVAAVLEENAANAPIRIVPWE